MRLPRSGRYPRSWKRRRLVVGLGEAGHGTPPVDRHKPGCSRGPGPVGGANKSSSGRVVKYSCPRACSVKRWPQPPGLAPDQESRCIMNNLTTVCLRPILRLMPRSTRSDSHGGPRGGLTAGQTPSTPLNRSSILVPCAVCIEAGRVTEATHQTRDQLCGCDKHIQELEQHGRAAVRRQRRAAVRRQRSAEPHGYRDRGAPPARGTTGDRPASLRD